MTTWLIDTALLKTLGSPHALRLKRWVDANDASLFLSAASLTEIAAAIGKTPASQPQKSAAMRTWLEGISTQYADRIHPVDAEIATRAGALLPSIRNVLPRHRLHDAILLATAQFNGHSLLTRRDGVFGQWAIARSDGQEAMLTRGIVGVFTRKGRPSAAAARRDLG